MKPGKKLFNGLAWGALGLLLAAFFLWLGGNTQKRRGSQRYYPKVAVEVIDLHQTLRKLFRQPETFAPGAQLRRLRIDEPQQHYLPIAADTFPQIPVDKYLLVNYYDPEEECYRILLLDLAAGRAAKHFCLPYRKIRRAGNSLLQAAKGSRFHQAFAGEKAMKTCLFHLMLLPGDRLLFPFPYTPYGSGPYVIYDTRADTFRASRVYGHHSYEWGPDSNLWFARYQQRNKTARLKHYDGHYQKPGSYEYRVKDDWLYRLNMKTGRYDSLAFFEKIIAAPERDFRALNDFDRQDALHTNDVQPVFSDGPFWQKGDLFLSLREPSMLALFRPETREVVWSQMLPWKKQHDVNVLNDSVITVLSNEAVSPCQGHDWVPGNYNKFYFYNFARDSAYTLPAIQQIFRRQDIATATQGRARFFPQDSALFVEATEQGKILLADLRQDTSWVLAVPSLQAGKVENIRWSRVYERVP